jgi:hypothetical protein
VACFSSPKTDRQLTSFHHQSTTTSPSKHHVLPPAFAKTPSKDKVPPPPKITAEALFNMAYRITMKEEQRYDEETATLRRTQHLYRIAMISFRNRFPLAAPWNFLTRFCGTLPSEEARYLLMRILVEVEEPRR